MMLCMSRTNLVLDDALLRDAMRYSRARTKRALVEEALRTFVEVKSAEEHRASYEDRLAGILARTQTLSLRQSAAQLVREDRERDS
jgi:Arc/MetJ family transcription regulator